MIDQKTQELLEELKKNHQPPKIGYVPPEDAARFIGVAPQTLARWRCEGLRDGVHGPPFFRVGRKIMYAIEDLTAWMNARRVSSTSEAVKSA